MLGIGQDFRLYQKKGIDWRIRQWENSEERRGTNSGSNTQLIDVYMDNDSRMVGLVLDSESHSQILMCNLHFHKPLLAYDKHEHIYQ
jgi:hypothetical protein